jgi:hypothetical protein
LRLIPHAAGHATRFLADLKIYAVAVEFGFLIWISQFITVCIERDGDFPAPKVSGNLRGKSLAIFADRGLPAETPGIDHNVSTSS